MKYQKHSQSVKDKLREWAPKRPIIATFPNGKKINYESINAAARENHKGRPSCGSVWRVLVGQRRTFGGISYEYDGPGTPQKDKV